MRISRLSMLAVLLTVLAGCATPIKHVVPPAGREVAGGRDLLVTVTQTEMIAGINESNLTGAMGGGLLFALIDAGVNQSRAKKAEQAIVPVRNALTDYPFEKKAVALSEEIVRSVPWLGVRRTDLNKDPGNARFSAAIDGSPGPQLLSITYDYLLDNGFQTLKVGANMSLLPKTLAKGGKPEQRALIVNADFNRQIVVILPLEGAVTTELDQNAALWAKDGGKQAEDKLDRALAKLGPLMRKALEFTAEQDKALDKTKNQNVQGVLGKVIETDAEGTLLRNNFGLWFYVFRPGVAPTATATAGS
jgi:hypothetical protein